MQGSIDPFNEFYSNSTQQNLTAVDKELMDVLGFNLNLPTTVIESKGSTDLDQVGSNYFLYAHGTTSGPELSLGNGAPVVAGQFGPWAPIGAEQTASGYDVAWKMSGADQYQVSLPKILSAAFAR